MEVDMVRIVIRALVFLGSAALGLLVAAWIVDGVEVTAGGFVITAVIYAVAQSVLSPFLYKVAFANARAFLGGIGLVSAGAALLIASIVGDSLTISGGLGTWVLASLVVWLATAVATLLLPMALIKAGVESARDDGKRPQSLAG